jgi:sporulation protein YlmC with PRC-barrel domain
MIQRLMMTSAFVALIATGALAQTVSPTPNTTSRGATTTAGAGTAGGVVQMRPDQVRASKLIGSTVYGPDDKSIGDVSDLILERDSRVSAAVLSVGGFLGIGDKRVAVPINELRQGNGDHITVNMTKDQLQQAPKFEYADRGRPTDAARSGSSTPAPTGVAPTAPSTGAGTSTTPR